jgi:hypothetical protein
VEDIVIQKSRIWDQFEALSPAAQRQVADFIAFLSSRDARRPASPRAPVRQESFAGIWKDREDLSDSTGWVRRLRNEEWGK